MQLQTRGAGRVMMLYAAARRDVGPHGRAGRRGHHDDRSAAQAQRDPERGKRGPGDGHHAGVAEPHAQRRPDRRVHALVAGLARRLPRSCRTTSRRVACPGRRFASTTRLGARRRRRSSSTSRTERTRGSGCPPSPLGFASGPRRSGSPRRRAGNHQSVQRPTSTRHDHHVYCGNHSDDNQAELRRLLELDDLGVVRGARRDHHCPRHLARHAQPVRAPSPERCNRSSGSAAETRGRALIVAVFGFALSSGSPEGAAAAAPADSTTTTLVTISGDFAFSGAVITGPGMSKPRTLNAYQSAVYMQSWLGSLYSSAPVTRRNPPPALPVYEADA